MEMVHQHAVRGVFGDVASYGLAEGEEDEEAEIVAHRRVCRLGRGLGGFAGAPRRACDREYGNQGSGYTNIDLAFIMFCVAFLASEFYQSPWK
jgi:hypothetical protein